MHRHGTCHSDCKQSKHVMNSDPQSPIAANAVQRCVHCFSPLISISTTLFESRVENSHNDSAIFCSEEHSMLILWIPPVTSSVRRVDLRDRGEHFSSYSVVSRADLPKEPLIALSLTKDTSQDGSRKANQ